MSWKCALYDPRVPLDDEEQQRLASCVAATLCYESRRCRLEMMLFGDDE